MKCITCGGPLTGRQKLYCKPSCKVGMFLRRKRQGLRKRIVAYLGGKCRRCGYSQCIRALSVHHKDPSKKGFSLKECEAVKRSWEAVCEELDKCELLCANCHMELHCTYGC